MNTVNVKLITLLVLLWVAYPVFSQQYFTEVDAGIGMHEGLGQAAAFCDIDNDGWPDLAFSSNVSKLWLYHNQDGQFTEITEEAGLDNLGASVIIWAEITGDEFTDLIINDNSQKAFRNTGELYFVEITQSCGISGNILAAADFDKDGMNDLVSVSGGLNIQFNNSGVFENYALTNGLYHTACCIDYNLDGYMDIYIGSQHESNSNKLYKNNGNRTFIDVTEEAGVGIFQNSPGITSGDYNNDGWPDLYVGVYKNIPANPSNVLFMNNGDGTFSNVTQLANAGGEEPSTRTASFVDYDNDGFLDIFLSDKFLSNTMYHNNGDGTFTNTADELGLNDLMGNYYSISFGDINLDGALDLFVAGHADNYKMYQNMDCPGNFIHFDLEGQSSNYNALGSRIRLKVNDQWLTRFVKAGEGYQDFHSLEVEFGLGTASMVDEVIIDWPSGITQYQENIMANQRIQVFEDSVFTEVAELSSDMLSVYPNPTEGIINIQINTSAFGADISGFARDIIRQSPEDIRKLDNWDIRILDITGQEIYNLNSQISTPNSSLKIQHSQLDMRSIGLPPGIYFIQVRHGQSVSSHKIIFSK